MGFIAGSSAISSVFWTALWLSSSPLSVVLCTLPSICCASVMALV